MLPFLKRIALNIVTSNPISSAIVLNSKLHTSAALNESEDPKGPRKFLSYNKKVYPPQSENEEPRLAVTCPEIFLKI